MHFPATKYRLCHSFIFYFYLCWKLHCWRKEEDWKLFSVLLEFPMEYERIDKVQNEACHHRKKDGSNHNSSRTEDAELVNSLLDCENGDFDQEVPSLDVALVKESNGAMLDSGLNDQVCSQTKESLPLENIEAGRAKLQQLSKTDSGNSSAIHLMRSLEDDNLDYDSNASSSSFEFHKGERVVHNSMTRSYLRPMPSKWNDAEKWIMNRQNLQASYANKNAFPNQANRFAKPNMARVAPDSAYYDLRSTVNRTADTRRFDIYQPAAIREVYCMMNCCIFS
ncbi:hypothetical protein GQ457_05G027150 [Hibiscus cannabinus]